MAKKPSNPRSRASRSRQRNLPLDHRLVAEPGEYTLTGQPAQFTHPLRANDLSTGSPEVGRPEVKIVEAVGTAAGAGGAVGVGHALRVDDATSASTMDSPTLTARPPATPRARRKIRKTTKRSVSSFAPTTRTLVDKLIQNLNAQRHNDNPTGELLDALRELHGALGDLIARAETGAQLEPAAKVVARLEAHVGRTIRKGAKIGSFLAETALLSIMMSMVLGMPVDSTMAAGVMAYIAAKETKGTKRR